MGDQLMEQRILAWIGRCTVLTFTTFITLWLFGFYA